MFRSPENLVFSNEKGVWKRIWDHKLSELQFYFRKQRRYQSFFSVVDQHTNRQPESHWFISLVPFPKVGDGRCSPYILYATIGFDCKSTYVDLQKGPHLAVPRFAIGYEPY